MQAKEERKRLFNFIQRCRFLQSLTLRNVDDIHDDDLVNLEKNSHLARVSFGMYLTTRIQMNSLGGCLNLTDDCIKHVTKCENLTHINLAVTQVTDEGLYELCNKAPKLQHVNLYACEQVTLDGIYKLIKNLENLHDINIRGCNVDYIHDSTLGRNVQVLTGPSLTEGIYS